MKENAVSEVIGVVLLLALVVIGMGMAGVVVLSLISTNEVPNVQVITQLVFNMTTGDYDHIRFIHDGGDILNIPDDIRIKADGSEIDFTKCEYSDPWTLGQIITCPEPTSPPGKIEILYQTKGRESLFYSSSNLQRVYLSQGLYGDWESDTEDPTICCVELIPSGSDVQTCSNTKITWQASDNTRIHSTTLEFFDGTDYIRLPGKVTNPPYTWNVPGNPGQGKIRVTVRDLAGNSASDESQLFSIVDTKPPVVQILSPKGGETWDLGATKEIRWSVDECDPNRVVKIDLTTDNKATWTTIIGGLPDTGKYSWQVSGDPTLSAYIMVSVTDSAGNTGVATSPSPFTIRKTTLPTVKVDAPNGGEQLAVGTSYPIRWTATDDVEVVRVNIDITYDGGNTWSSIISGWTNTGVYDWVPDTPSNNARIRITVWDPFNNSFSDLSDNSFTIQPGSAFHVRLISPNGGEQLASGNVHIIRWTIEGSGLNDQVTIEYSLNNGVDWTSIGTGTAITQFLWTVPCQQSNTLRVKVTVTRQGETVFDISDNTFSIALPESTVMVKKPNGGEVIYGDSKYTIEWTADNACGITGVDIFYTQNNGISYEPIVTGITNSGNYQWSVPNIQTLLARVKVVAHLSGTTSIEDISNNVFEIRNAAPIVVVTSPNGGEKWESGSQQQIIWTATDSDGIASITIDYSINNGLSWLPVASALPNDGSYTWQIPATETNQALVRVTATDTLGNTGSDKSNAIFSIINGPPQVTLIYPNGGQVFSTGETVTITWSAVDPDGISKIDLSYSINDNPFTFEIAKGLSNTGSYVWTTPHVPSEKMRVIVTAYDTPGAKASDQSDSFFTIADTIPPVITITRPVGGERFRINQNPHLITWTASDNVGVSRIKLEYSRNSGASWTQIIDNLSNNGEYYWYITGSTSDTCKVRVTAYDSAGLSASSITPGTFRITSS